MKTKNIAIGAGVLLAIGAGIGGGWWVGMSQGMQMAAGPESTPASQGGPQKAGDIDPANGKKVLYWHDPMVPNNKFDKPGKSPFMDMMLVPKYGESGEADDGKVAISPRVQQNLGVRTAEVTQGNFVVPVEAIGTVAYNERDASVVSTRVAGTLEKLTVRAPLDRVRKGQVVAELYVPEWLAAQEEYLLVRRLQGDGMKDLADAARQRMVVSGVPDEIIRAVERTGQVQRRLALTAQTGGVIADLTAREGMSLMGGAVLMRINGLSSVWVNADVPESQAADIRPGTPVEARTPALPGVVFTGKVGALLPDINMTTRTIKARVELANPRGELLPGMFASLTFAPAARKAVLQVPTEAVIQTGKRTVVMVAEAGGKFAPVDVEIGTEANGETEIRKGLKLGQKVVTSGQFLLDSESSLTATTTRMGDASAPVVDPAKPMTKSMSGDVTHHGEGKVEAIDKAEVTLSHGPIPSLKWGPMTMGFKLPTSGAPTNIAVGDRVSFDFVDSGDGEYKISTIAPMAPTPTPKPTTPMSTDKNKGTPK